MYMRQVHWIQGRNPKRGRFEDLAEIDGREANANFTRLSQLAALGSPWTVSISGEEFVFAQNSEKQQMLEVLGSFANNA